MVIKKRYFLFLMHVFFLGSQASWGMQKNDEDMFLQWLAEQKVSTSGTQRVHQQLAPPIQLPCSPDDEVVEFGNGPMVYDKGEDVYCYPAPGEGVETPPETHFKKLILAGNADVKETGESNQKDGV